MNLVGFIIRIYHDARSPECQIESRNYFVVYIYIYIYIYIYRVSQKECARLREGVPYVKVYQIYIYIKGIPGGMCQTSGGCSLC